MLRLNCAVKNYEWGQPGSTSLVADLAWQGEGKQTTDTDKPYAELWMGSHLSGPSMLSKSGEGLNTWLQRNPLALGEEVLSQHGASLPFLFKVLSVQKCLSIQSHPDKALAEQLHKERPNVYKDPNHKPEMALAVKDFQALCGFCYISEIVSHIEKKPEIGFCLGSEAFDALQASVVSDAVSQRAALGGAFKALMTCAQATYQAASQRLYQRLKACDASHLHEKDCLFLRVYDQYPGDVGTLAVYFLNYLQLQPGEAIFLPANEPHAYLSGELIEAMANSDNVIRAGLTPKLRDTQVLCDSLTYNQGPPQRLLGERVTSCILKYQPPFHEFQVLKISVENPGVLAIPAQRSPMILVCLTCEGQHSLLARECEVEDPALEEMVSITRGGVLFVPAHTPLELHSMASDDSSYCPMLAYAATANDNMFAHSALSSSGSETSSTLQHTADAYNNSRNRTISESSGSLVDVPSCVGLGEQ